MTGGEKSSLPSKPGLHRVLIGRLHVEQMIAHQRPHVVVDDFIRRLRLNAIVANGPEDAAADRHSQHGGGCPGEQAPRRLVGRVVCADTRARSRAGAA